MSTNFEIEHEHESGLTSERWSFYHRSDLHILWLDEYYAFERPTKRHKFRAVRGYARGTRSRTRFDSFEQIDWAQVPWSDALEAEIKAEFMRRLKIQLESDRR